MATKKNTRKTTGKKTGSQTAKKQETPEKSALLPRPAWALIWGVLGLLCLLALLPVDGFLLRALHRGIGAMIGTGVYVLPFALFGLCALLLQQRKGPVRLRGAAILLLPVFVGALVQSFTAADAYALSAQTFPTLISSGMEMTSGGLIAGSLYLVLEWSLSSIGALIILLLLIVAALLCSLHITPAALYDMLRPPEYEYEDENERSYYEEPKKLPNVHEIAAARAEKRAEKREEKRGKMEIDIPIDDGPSLPQPESVPGAAGGKPIAPDEYLRAVSGKKGSSILELVQNAEIDDDSAPEDKTKAPAAQKKTENIGENEQAEMNAKMDESQKAPAPAYEYPPVSLLTQGKHTSIKGAEQELKENSECLLDTLHSFGIDAKIVGIVRGPSVTRFELNIPRGIKISRITALSEDVALSLGAVSVRIAPIPDKVAVGVEVPNKLVNTVFIRECISSPQFGQAKSRLSFALGKDITGAPVISDIAKMPHLLIAGTTGSGKSVCINSMLISLLYKSTPEQVRLIMVDPKMVELGNYNGIPHLLIPVVTDPKKAAGALNWAVGEMERRYKLFADNYVRNLTGYNDLMRQKRAEAEAAGGVPDEFQVLPQIVIVIDELADLMMVAAKEVETSICRIAQKARAAGMHLIVATQRPSADVITGIMKANIPSRIAFAVASQIESRIILDQTGAEKLIGKGDMLYAPLGEGKPLRVQGCFISSDEIEGVIAFIKEKSTVEYNEEILEHIERQLEAQSSGSTSGGDPAEDEDEMLMDAIDVVMETHQASASMLQRRLRVGYARAARLVDQMEERGIVGPFEGSKARQLLISREDWQEMKVRRQDIP